MRNIPILAGVLLLATSLAHAADGTWNTSTDGNWSNSGSWNGGIIADGQNFTATFHAPTPSTTDPIVVSLDSDRIIGNLATPGLVADGTHNYLITGPNTLTLSTGTATAPGISASQSGRSTTVNVILAGTEGLNLANTSSGLLTIGGNNTYSGLTQVVTGAIVANNNNAFGSTSGATTVTSIAALQLNNGITVTGETLNLSGNGTGSNLGAIHTATDAVATWTGDINLNTSVRIGANGAASVLTLSGAITGGPNLSFSHGNDTNPNGTVVLSGASSYTGTTTIFRGTLKLDGGNNRLPITTLLTLGQTNSASAFDLNGQNQQINGLSNSTANASSRTVTNSSASPSLLTFNNTADQTFLGDVDDVTSITGNLSILKAGSFTQTLAKTNSYTGNTTVTAGTLILADNATMTFYIGNNGVNNRIAGSGNLTLNGDFIFDLDGANLSIGNAWNIVNVGTLNEGFGLTFLVQGFTETFTDSGIWQNNLNNDLTFSELSGNLQVVPEPSSSILLLGGLGLLAVVCRRKR